jgi:hypothetical protein
VVSRVQRLRKEAGYAYSVRITWWIDGEVPVVDAVRAHAGSIRGETLARCLEVGARAPAPDLEQPMDIDGQGAVVGVQRLLDGRDSSRPQPMDE